MAIENRGPELQAVCATFVSLAFTATCLRIFVRLRLVKAFGWDDWFMISATLTHIMFATCAIGGIHYGTGRHMWDLTPIGIYKAMRYWWLCYIAYCLTMIASKISIGIFLLRVTVIKIHRWIIYTVMGLTVLTGLVFFFVTLLQCTPISYFWNRTQPGSCIDINVIIGLTFLYSAISAICDFTFGILPIFLVWNLNMTRTNKLLLVPILSMACVASTAVVVRMAFVMDFKTNDFLYKTVDIAIWSDIEQGLAITAGSLATLRPLYRLIAEKIGLSQTGTNPRIGPSGAATPYGKRSTFSNQNSNSGKRGPFSLITFTKHDNKSDEEYGLGNVKPMPLPDDGSENGSAGRDEKGFSTWRIQVGENHSQEELNRKGSDPGPGRNNQGITRKTDVYIS